MSLTRIVFGHVPPSRKGDVEARMDELAARLAEHIGLAVERRAAASYEALAGDVREGHVDLAWLPPIAFVRLGDAVTALGSVVRGRGSSYEAALVVRRDSKIRTIDALRGTRAGWVDPWSAAGFVLPRVQLTLSGVDPRTLFRTETFHGSHRSAIEALVEGACDVAGTYARPDANGEITEGAWSEIEGASVRVLTTFGAIPPDVLAVRTAIAGELRARALDALKRLCSEHGETVRAVLGGDAIADGLAPGYDALQKALDAATARGIFD